MNLGHEHKVNRKEKEDMPDLTHRERDNYTELLFLTHRLTTARENKCSYMHGGSPNGTGSIEGNLATSKLEVHLSYQPLLPLLVSYLTSILTPRLRCKVT